MIRFSLKNWERFETHGKKTTIRLRKVKHGVHVAGRGSPQWGTWVAYPEKVYAHSLKKECMVKELNDDDARLDGFDSLCELLLELGGLNRQITPDSMAYVYPIRKITKAGEMQEHD